MYQPDFVADVAGALWMIEVKAVNQIGADDMREKKRAAAEWCRHASE